MKSHCGRFTAYRLRGSFGKLQRGPPKFQAKLVGPWDDWKKLREWLTVHKTEAQNPGGLSKTCCLGKHLLKQLGGGELIPLESMDPILGSRQAIVGTKPCLGLKHVWIPFGIYVNGISQFNPSRFPTRSAKAAGSERKSCLAWLFNKWVTDWAFSRVEFWAFSFFWEHVTFFSTPQDLELVEHYLQSTSPP